MSSTWSTVLRATHCLDCLDDANGKADSTILLSYACWQGMQHITDICTIASLPTHPAHSARLGSLAMCLTSIHACTAFCSNDNTHALEIRSCHRCAGYGEPDEGDRIQYCCSYTPTLSASSVHSDPEDLQAHEKILTDSTLLYTLTSIRHFRELPESTVLHRPVRACKMGARTQKRPSAPNSTACCVHTANLRASLSSSQICDHYDPTDHAEATPWVLGLGSQPKSFSWI